MSTKSTILVMETDAEEVRLSLAQQGRASIDILETLVFSSHEAGDLPLALLDQTVIDLVAGLIAQRGWEGKQVVCLIAGEAVSTQFLTLPPLKGASLRQAVMLKLGHQLHFDVADAVVEIKTVGECHSGGHAHRRIAVDAMRSDCASDVVRVLSGLGLRLVILTSKPAALTALAIEAAGDEDSLEAVLHVDERASTLIILRRRQACIACEVTIGLRDFGLALTRPIVSGDEIIELEQSEAFALRDRVGIPAMDEEISSLGVNGDRLRPLLEPVIQKLSLQLTQWFTFAATIEDGMNVKRVTMTGPGGAMPGLAKAVASGTDVSTRQGTWLDGRVRAAGAVGELDIETFAAATGAIRHIRSLSDLIPGKVRQHRKIQQLRRSTARVCPILALAVLGIAFMFDPTGTKVQFAHGQEWPDLAEMKLLLADNATWDAKQKQVDAMQHTLDVFAQSTPNWTGVFKELARLLPGEFWVREFWMQVGETGMSLTVEGDVFTTPSGRRFNEVVEQTLKSLEESPFFGSVTLKKANQAVGEEKRRRSGTLAFELQLVYRTRPGTG